jgi:hypothetical protein
LETLDLLVLVRELLVMTMVLVRLVQTAPHPLLQGLELSVEQE